MLTPFFSCNGITEERVNNLEESLQSLHPLSFIQIYFEYQETEKEEGEESDFDEDEDDDDDDNDLL